MPRTGNKAFQALCRYLRANAASAAGVNDDMGRGEPPWLEVVAEANGQYLGPALWCALEASGDADQLPADVREFLEESARLNLLRNETIRAQCVELLEALEAIGVQPILLKGGAQLFMGDMALRARMMVDLDVLVRPAALASAAEVAANLGYRIVHEHEDWHHDYHILGRGSGEAALEFHRTVGQQRHIVSLDKAYGDACRLPLGDNAVFVLSPTDRVLHNIFHAAIQDRAHHLGRIPLRALHDLGLIRAQCAEEDIDWGHIQRTLGVAGYGNVLSAYLYMAQVFLGQSVPSGIEPGLSAHLHLLRCRVLRRSRILRRAMDLWATITHPFGRAHYEYLYGEAPNDLALLWGRLKLAGHILTKHRHKLLAKLLTEYRKLYRSG